MLTLCGVRITRRAANVKFLTWPAFYGVDLVNGRQLVRN
jgi:hypothetical protein